MPFKGYMQRLLPLLGRMHYWLAELFAHPQPIGRPSDRADDVDLVD